VSDIDRGEQDDTGHDGEQDDAAGASLVHTVSEVRNCARTTVVVVRGVNLLKRGSNGASLDICLFGDGSRCKPAHEV
jgi:hypothetical protein